MYIEGTKKQTLHQSVNSVGKYIFKNLDGAYKFDKRSNQFDIYTTILYEVPKEIRDMYELDEDYSQLHEMNLLISLTTYQTKLRVNVIELSPEEITIGHTTLNLEKYNEYKSVKDRIVMFILGRLEKRYEGYDFIF